MQDLSLRHQVLDRASDVLDRHRGIDTVLVKQVDAISAQALEHAFDGELDALRPAVESGAALTWLRNGATPSPRIRSTSCGPYASAASKKVTPLS
jgi:hypothetical protein